jgi:chromosome transmission fidelity protein 1
LRNHKKEQHAGAIAAVKDGMKDEPEWMIEQMLRRKRQELVQRWQDREDRLAKIRAKERELEASRSNKRRRVEEPASRRGGKDIDEDAEFLLDDWSEETGEDDPMSMYSKETRALLVSVGLGAPRKQEEEAEDEEEIKVVFEPCYFGGTPTHWY